jgi:hypothetical protein
MRLRVVAERQALPILSQQGIPVEEPPSAPKERELFLRSLFRQVPPDALLLGTSRGATIEKELLRIGQEGEIPSLAVVDHWAHYRERFLEPDSKALRLPDRIALMDSEALEQAVADGLPREILKITGQPHLQSLAAALNNSDLRRQAGELRSRWLRGARGPLILFCSETFSDDRGYTETDALEGVAEALDLFEERHAVQPKLVVKLHPKQPADRFRAGLRASRRGFKLAQAESPWACLLAADRLVGITSMLLMEAVVAGRPAISYQPEQGRAVPFVGQERGIVRAARSVRELAALLSDSRAPEDPDSIRRILAGDAATQIVDLLMELQPVSGRRG